MTMLIALLALIAPAQQEVYPPGTDIGKTEKLTPINSPQSWITNKDYPPSSRRAQHQGMVGFRLDVAADGSVVECTITQSSGHVMLDKGTCDLLLKRARFKPARDRNGNAIPATWSSRFLWSL